MDNEGMVPRHQDCDRLCVVFHGDHHDRDNLTCLGVGVAQNQPQVLCGMIGRRPKEGRPRPNYTQLRL